MESTAPFAGYEATVACLRRFMHDAYNMTVLRKVLYADSYQFGIHSLSDQEVISQVARKAVRGQIFIARRKAAQYGGGSSSPSVKEVVQVEGKEWSKKDYVKSFLNEHEIEIEPPEPKVEIQPGCRLISADKKLKLTAVGTPNGGTYQWTASGWITIVGAANKLEVEIKGSNASASLNDSTLSVRYQLGGKTATDSTTLTTYKVGRIEAKLRDTPCKRSGSNSNTMAAKSTTRDSKIFDATAITIVRGCDELELTATVTPNGVPLSWKVERATDDNAALSGLPTDSANGSSNKRKLKADATGSFHICAFVDCDHDGARSVDDGGIILNVNIVNVEVMSGAANNKILTRTNLFNDASSNVSYLVVHSGSTNGVAPGVNASYTDAKFTKYPMSFKVTIKLVGGGADQRRGTDDVRAGYIQVTTADSVTGIYAGSKTVKEAIFVNAGLSNPVTTGTPATLSFPVRDTRGANNKGSGPFIISSSDVDKANLSTGGKKRVVRMLEPPAIVLPLTHPVSGGALTSISGTNDFSTFLSAYSTDFDENYVVVGSTDWTIAYGSYTAAAGWSQTGVAVTSGASMTTFSPPKRAEDLERRTLSS